MRTEPTVTPASTTHAPPNGLPAKTSKSASLATKPKASGTPAIDAAVTTPITTTGRQRRPKPGNARMSRVPVSWSMIPTTMKSAAL